LFITPATQAYRSAGPAHVHSRQVDPIEADSKVGDRPNDHAGDAARAVKRPMTSRRTGRHIDMYV
jgi:hypothetical protein